MPLIDMKRKAAKDSKNTLGDGPIVVNDSPNYPWGLRITLQKEELVKLNIGTKDVSIGESIFFSAEAQVTAVSKDLYDGSSEVVLQIVKLSLDKKTQKKASKFAEYNKQKKAGPTE